MECYELRSVVRRRKEPRVSFWCGIPAIVVAVLAMILLGSYLWGRAIGPSGLYEVERIRGEEFDIRGSSIGDVWRDYYLPSVTFVTILVINACVAGMGISLGRRRSRSRPIRTSATALVLSIADFIMVLMTWLRAGN
ncbi:MAG: hypothetical protein U0790_02960 [Isosphaeraceae bacterium]